MKYFLKILFACWAIALTSSDFICADEHNASNNATVLLIYMFSGADLSKDLYLATLIERVDNAFKEKEIDAIIIPIWSNVSESYTFLRQEQLFNEINRKLIENPDLTITHIIFAGLGNSDENTLLIGDIIFHKNTLNNLIDKFEMVRSRISSRLKIFLYGSSTFSGNPDDILAKAQWFRRIFRIKEIEIFGYEHNISSEASNSFWLDDFKTISAGYAAILFTGFMIVGREHNTLFTRKLWKYFLMSLPSVPVCAAVHYSFNKYLRYSFLITKLRELYYHNNMGTVIAFSGPIKKRFERMLGYDYFRNNFVLP